MGRVRSPLGWTTAPPKVPWPVLGALIPAAPSTAAHGAASRSQGRDRLHVRVEDDEGEVEPDHLRLESCVGDLPGEPHRSAAARLPSDSAPSRVASVSVRLADSLPRADLEHGAPVEARRIRRDDDRPAPVHGGRRGAGAGVRHRRSTPCASSSTRTSCRVADIGIDEVANAVAGSNVNLPTGVLWGTNQASPCRPPASCPTPPPTGR